MMGAAPEFRQGDRAWAGAAILELPDLSSVHLLARLDESDRSRLKAGQAAVGPHRGGSRQRLQGQDRQHLDAGARRLSGHLAAAAQLRSRPGAARRRPADPPGHDRRRAHRDRARRRTSCSSRPKRSSSATARPSSTSSTARSSRSAACRSRSAARNRRSSRRGSSPAIASRPGVPSPEMIRRSRMTRRRYLWPAIGLVVVGDRRRRRLRRAASARTREHRADGARHQGAAQGHRPRQRRASRRPDDDARDAAGRRHAAHRSDEDDRHAGQERRDRHGVRSRPIRCTRSSRRSPSWRKPSRKSSR